MIKLCKTRNGKPMIIEDGFEYCFNSKNKAGTRKYWACTNRETCKARIITNFDVEESIIVYKSAIHTHIGNPYCETVRQATEIIKTIAKENPNQAPSSIVQEAIREIRDVDVLVDVSERTALLKMVNRYQNSTRPALPSHVQNCIIESPYNLTYTGNEFLRFDSGPFDANRVIIFYSDLGLKSIARSNQLYADGTFDTVPRLFFQLYTIHADIFGYTFPCVYVLCNKKNKVTYEKIYNHLIDACSIIGLSLSPESIMVDFEAASMVAIKNMFGNSRVKGCLFHLNQSLWRNIQNSGLSAHYRNPDEAILRYDIVSYLALAFLPPEDLINVFKELSFNQNPLLNDFIKFYGSNYIGVIKVGNEWEDVVPRFHPDVWSCYNSVLSGIRRTNNVVEGWHSRFQGAILAKHATIWKFIDFIKKDERDNEILIIQLFGGHRKVRHPIKKRYILNNERIESLVRSYDEFKRNNQVRVYLNSIGRLLKNNFFFIPEPNSEDPANQNIQ